MMPFGAPFAVSPEMKIVSDDEMLHVEPVHDVLIEERAIIQVGQVFVERDDEDAVQGKPAEQFDPLLDGR